MEVPPDPTYGEEEPAEEIFTVVAAPLPPDRGANVSVEVVVEPVVKSGALVPFSVLVFDGFGFADADAVPASAVYRRTLAGPFALFAVVALAKRPGTTGLYDGFFTPSALAPASAPDLYDVTADVAVGLDSRRWSAVTMAIAPCS
jgi:hypothetical protein